MKANYLEVFLDGMKLSAGGGVDVDVITLSLVGGKDNGRFWIQMSGRRNDVNVEWLQREIACGTELVLIPRDDVANLDTGGAQTSIPPVPKCQSLDGIKALRVSSENIQPQIARIGKEDTLQLVVSWTSAENRWKLELDSLTVDDRGFTTGTHWLDCQLAPNKPVAISPILEQA